MNPNLNQQPELYFEQNQPQLQQTGYPQFNSTYQDSPTTPYDPSSKSLEKTLSEKSTLSFYKKKNINIIDDEDEEPWAFFYQPKSKVTHLSVSPHSHPYYQNITCYIDDFGIGLGQFKSKNEDNNNNDNNNNDKKKKNKDKKNKQEDFEIEKIHRTTQVQFLNIDTLPNKTECIACYFPKWGIGLRKGGKWIKIRKQDDISFVYGCLCNRGECVVSNFVNEGLYCYIHSKKSSENPKIGTWIKLHDKWNISHICVASHPNSNFPYIIAYFKDIGIQIYNPSKKGDDEQGKWEKLKNPIEDVFIDKNSKKGKEYNSISLLDIATSLSQNPVIVAYFDSFGLCLFDFELNLWAKIHNAWTIKQLSVCCAKESEAFPCIVCNFKNLGICVFTHSGKWEKIIDYEIAKKITHLKVSSSSGCFLLVGYEQKLGIFQMKITDEILKK